MTRCGRLWVLMLVAVVWSACRSANTAEPWRELFDGSTLNGWQSWLRGNGPADPQGVFTVTNRQLRISGDGMGYLVTRESFRDFHLVVEWRWGQTNRYPERVGKARDSGIFVHVTGPDGNSHDGAGAFRAGLEHNLMEGAVGDLLLIRGNDADGSLIAPEAVVETAPEPDAEGWFTWRAGGARRRIARWGRINRSHKSTHWSDTDGFICPSGLERPAGAWNTTEIVAVGRRLEFRLNGQAVNRLSEVRPTGGFILLQCEGAEIFFRRIRLRPLMASP